MMRPRIALLSCGEAVYPEAWLLQRIAEIRDGLAAREVEIAVSATVLDEPDVEPTRAFLRGRDLDLVVVHFVSWHITSYLVPILQEIPGVPVLAWATSGLIDPSGKLHAPAAPAALTALLPMLREMGVRYKAIAETPGQPHRFDEALGFARAAATARRLRRSRIGLVGYADMGLYTCAYDRTALAARIGIDVEDHFSYEIGQRMEQAESERVEEAVRSIRERIDFENDVPAEVLDRVARLYLVLADKSSERRLDGISIKCVQGVTRYMGVNPCVAQSLLAGPDLSVICECDAHGLVTNVMMSLLTGQTTTFMEHYEFFDREVLVGTCGFLPIGLSEGRPTARATNLGDFFKGMGMTSRLKEGPVTVARLFRNGEGYGMFLGRAQARRPGKWIELGWEEPTPDFPSLTLDVGSPVQDYLERVPGQHVILAHGDHVGSMRDLCGLLGLEVHPWRPA